VTYTLANLTGDTHTTLREAIVTELTRTSPLMDAMNTHIILDSIRTTGMTIEDAKAHRALCDRIRFGRVDAYDAYDEDTDTFVCEDCGRNTGPEVGPCPAHQPADYYWDTHPNEPQGPAQITPTPQPTPETYTFHRAGSEPTA
jgi:hypothetical protein